MSSVQGNTPAPPQSFPNPSHKSNIISKHAVLKRQIFITIPQTVAGRLGAVRDSNMVFSSNPNTY